MKFKTNYSDTPLKGIKFTKPSRTQQQFKDEGNPYTVIRRHTQGLPVSLNRSTPQYLDVSDVDPSTHAQRITDLKKSIDDKNSEIVKRKNAKKEESEKAKDAPKETPAPGSQKD